MTQDDYDRVLGLVREQCKPELLRLVRVLRQNGHSKNDIGYGLVFLAQGLAEDALHVDEIRSACIAGNLERRRGALAEFHTPPNKDNRQPR